MKRASIDDREKILQYLRENLADCLYLYIDITNYGIASEHMQVWFEEEHDGIGWVVMKYYDSLQIYHHKQFPEVDSVKVLLQNYPVTMVSGRRELIEELAAQCKDYEAAYGEVFLMDKYRKIQDETGILRAAAEDAEEIAELICSDEEIGGHYTVENLAMQLAERIETKSGRSYIIRDEGEIAAHSATYAEAEGVAVVGGTIIHPKYRNTNYYICLSNYVLQELAAEGKRAYTFATSEKMIRYHQMLHSKCGEYGKLVKKGEAK